MTTVALCSAKGSPGVTTLMCILGAVWPPDRDVVLAECDPAGGDLAMRFGLSPNRGMTSLVLARRDSARYSSIEEHVHELPGGLMVLVGPVGADSATNLDREIGNLNEPLFESRKDALIDCGRLDWSAPGQSRMLRECDHILFLTTGDVSALAHARSALNKVKSARGGLPSLLLIGGGKSQREEISRVLNQDVVEVVPRDQRIAAIACGEPGRKNALGRSDFVAVARRLERRILSSGEVVSQAESEVLSRSTMEDRSAFRLLRRRSGVPRGGRSSFDAVAQ